MRITLGHKLAAVVALLSLVAVGISIFALRQANLEQQRAAATEAVAHAVAESARQAPGATVQLDEDRLTM